MARSRPTHLLLLGLLCALPAAVAAQSKPAPAPAAPRTLGLAVAPKLGGIFPQVFNRLETSYSLGVEVSYLLLWERVAAQLELSFTQPGHRRTIDDPRLVGGSASYRLDERGLGILLGAKGYILPLSSPFLAYGALGARLQLLESRLRGDAEGAQLGDHGETGTHLAGAAQLGGGMNLGPGYAFLELQLTTLPINHLITGPVDIGDLALRAGYQLRF